MAVRVAAASVTVAVDVAADVAAAAALGVADVAAAVAADARVAAAGRCDDCGLLLHIARISAHPSP